MIEQFESIKKIYPTCPICKKRFEISINRKIVENAKNFPISFSYEHCKKNLIMYLDANFMVRGVETSHIIENEVGKSISNDIIEKIYSNESRSIEKRTFYFCNGDCVESLKSKIPNLLERQLLRIINEEKGICLENLKDKVKNLEKAMNMVITYKMIKELLNKYVDSGLISIDIIDLDSIVEK